jgi:hypothetical protein
MERFSMKITRLFPAFVAGMLALGLAAFASTRTQGNVQSTLTDETVQAVSLTPAN